jgi:hypothetical protein
MLIALSDFAVKVNNVRQSTEKRFTDFVGNDRSSIDHNTSLAPQNATKKCQSQYGNDRAVHTCHDYIMHATSFGHYIRDSAPFVTALGSGQRYTGNQCMICFNLLTTTDLHRY